MTDLNMSRRALGLGTVALATAVSLQQAVAQTAAMGGGWMQMVQQQHAMIVENFDRILATRDNQVGERLKLQKRLTYLLTAHSVAEENVLYPALAMYGMVDGSDRLYIEQAHAKVMNSGLEMSPANTPDWIQRVGALKAALVHHAKDEEEGDLYPRLLQAAGPTNARLTAAYQREFQRVGMA